MISSEIITRIEASKSEASKKRKEDDLNQEMNLNLSQQFNYALLGLTKNFESVFFSV